MSEIQNESPSLSRPPTDPEHLVPPDSPVVLAHVIAEAIRELTENQHVHRWDILDVWKRPGPAHPRVMTPETIVLIRCQECNIPETTSLDGSWNLDQLRANLTEPINE